MLSKQKSNSNLSNKKTNYCFRCRENKEITAVCLDCRKALYCHSKCMTKNSEIHSAICAYYLEINPMIDAINKALIENFETRKEQN